MLEILHVAFIATHMASTAPSWTGSASTALEGAELVCSCGGGASGAAGIQCASQPHFTGHGRSLNF